MNAPAENPRLAAALFYAEEMGWPVVPNWWADPATGRCACPKGVTCRDPGKHPLGKLVPHGFREATTDRNRLADFWGQFPLANVGLRTGAASGLVALDVDVAGGHRTMADLESRHGRLPPTLTQRTGSGGEHRVHRHPGPGVTVRSRIRWLGRGVDVRGDGAQIIVAPSRGAAGPYEWLPGLGPGDVPVAALPDWLLERMGSTVGATGGLATERADRDVLPLSLPSLWQEHEELLAGTLPTRAGERHFRILYLARALKFNLGLADAPLSALRPVFAEWFRRALPVIRTKDFAESWVDFNDAFRNASHPLGADLSAVAWDLAAAAPPRAVALYPDDPGVQRLAGWCAALQSLTGGGPFGLSCHQVAARFGIDPKTAHRWLRALEVDGLLVCARRGCPGPPGSRSTRWTFRERARAEAA